MTRQTCSLPGCTKPIAASVSHSGAQHLTCGELHHGLLMAARFNPDLPPSPLALLDRNKEGFCALLPCSRPPWPGHQWCSRSHYLVWLADFYRGFRSGQICKLPGCTRHVYVDEPRDDGSPSLAHQFCGWRHCQKFTMLAALEQQQQQKPLSPPLSDESNYGHVPSLKYLLHALKKFALDGVTLKNIKVHEDFFTKHPWELLTEDGSCFLIARCKFMCQNNTKDKRGMVTKDHYHWKQQGGVIKKNGFSIKYFTYRRQKAKKKGLDQLHDESLYTMKECTVEAIKDYCLIKLCKGPPSVAGKRCNARVKSGSSDNTVIAGLDGGSDKRLDDANQNMDSWEVCPSVNSPIFGELESFIDLPLDSLMELPPIFYY